MKRAWPSRLKTTVLLPKPIPDKQIIITEAGWATNTNGRGIEPHNVNETFQEQYYQELMEWAEREQVLVYFL